MIQSRLMGGLMLLVDPFGCLFHPLRSQRHINGFPKMFRRAHHVKRFRPDRLPDHILFAASYFLEHVQAWFYGGGIVEAINFNALFFNHEIPFCKVYSVESKDKLEKLLLSNRISFFVEWPEQRLWHKFFGNGDAGRNAFTIRIK